MSEFQQTVDRLTGVPGIGPALAARLARAGVRTRPDLRKTTIRLPAATHAELDYAPCRAIPLAVARHLATDLAGRLRIGGRRPQRIRAVGSVRRGEPQSGDIDLLVESSADWADEIEFSGRGPEIVTQISGGGRQRMLVVWVPGLHCGRTGRKPVHGGAGRGEYVRVDLFRTTAAEWPFALLHFSNGAAYEKKVRAHAKRQNLLLNDRGLYTRLAGDKAGPPVRAPAGGWTERAILERIGLTYRSPAARSGT